MTKIFVYPNPLVNENLRHLSEMTMAPGEYFVPYRPFSVAYIIGFMRILGIAALFLSFLSSGCAASGSNNGRAASAAFADKMDAYVTAQMRRDQVPGLALGVYRNGTIVKVKGYGLSNVELGVPVTPETVFQSGSIGKQFTATAIMMLIEEGKVSLDDSITKYFPKGPEWWKEIQVRHLLSHTSGLVEYEAGSLIERGGPFYLRLDFTEDELLDKVEKLPMEFKPGDNWAYRDTNYLLLGFIIRKVTGKFYGDVLQERIFTPLGMTSTRIISESAIVPNRAAGYRLVNGQLQNQDWVSPTFNSTADGTLYFTVRDIAKWDEALYTGKLLSQASLRRMWTVVKLNDGRPNPQGYGFGWYVHVIHGRRVVEHGGVWQGFTCHIARYIDDHLTIAVLTNLDEHHSHPDRIARGVADLYLGSPALGRQLEETVHDFFLLCGQSVDMRGGNFGLLPDEPWSITNSQAPDTAPFYHPAF